MSDFTPKQLKKLQQLAGIVDKGNIGVFEHLVELEDTVDEKLSTNESTLAAKMQDTIDHVESIIEDKVRANMSLLKGEKGDAATKKDIENVLLPALARIPKPQDGKTPSKEYLQALISTLIPEAQPGQDADEEAITQNVTQTVTENIATMLPQFGTAFRDGLELLPEGEKLSITAIDGLRNELDTRQEQERTFVMGANRSLYQLLDVNVAGIASGQSIQWNGTSWVAYTPGAGSSPLTTKGDLYAFSTVNTRLPVGADTTVLIADSSQATGLRWGTISGSGTVTSVSVASANGFAGTVATATSTPAITLSTTITGIIKGNGTALSAAVAGTDYQIPVSLTTTGASGAATFNAGTGVLNIPQYAGTTYTAGTGLTLTTGAFSVNTSQNITTLSNLTVAGFVQSTAAGVLSSATLTLGQVTTALGFTPYNATNPSGYISANQSITLSGDITGTGSTAITTSIANNTVTNAKAAQMATLTIKGNNTGGTANAADLTVAQVNAILPVFTSTLNGLVPLSSGGTTNFLRADGTWATPAGGGTPGGSTTQVQYNNAGAFAGVSGVTTNGTAMTFASGTHILAGATSGTTILNAAAVAGSTTITLPAVTDTVAVLGTAQIFTAAQTITSSSANAFAVGLNGATNSTFKVDSSTALQASGITVKGDVTGGTPSITTSDSGANTSLAIDAKGTGNITIGAAASGSITLGNSFQGIMTLNTSNSNTAGIQFKYSSVIGQTFTKAAVNLGVFAQPILTTTARLSFNGFADVALTAATEAPSVYFNLGQTRTHTVGAIALQRDFRIIGSDHAASAASTFTDVAAFSVDLSTGSSALATITNLHNIYIPSVALTGTKTNSFGLTVNANTGATNNYAAQFNGFTNLNGGRGEKFTAVADTNYTALVTDYEIAYTTLTAARTVTIPTSTTAYNTQIFIIKDRAGTAGTNTITITPTSGTIDGAASKTITTNYGFIKIKGNGTNYFTTG